MLVAGNVTVGGKIDNTNNPLRGLDLPADCTPYSLPVDDLLKPKPTRTSAEPTLVFKVTHIRASGAADKMVPKNLLSERTFVMATHHSDRP